MSEEKQIEKFFVEELKIIQDIIKRLAFNSFIIKGWAVTLVIATLLLKVEQYQVIIAFIPLVGNPSDSCSCSSGISSES